MLKGKTVKIFLALFILLLIIFLVFKNYFKREKIIQPQQAINEEITYNSNIIENVNYQTNDADGNEYIITALKGEIDFTNTNIIFLTKVTAVIKLKNSENITITSDFGKYNSDNFDTIFSKNVIINYVDNKITGEYLDFSLERNSMIVSRDVIYTNLDNILVADVINVDIKTKIQKYLCMKKKKGKY